jgi:hypothetical protein
MITSVRLSIPGTPPETGASIQRIPVSRPSLSAMARVVAGLMLEWSTRILSGPPPDATPCSPNTTVSTAGVSVTQRITSRLARASSEGERARSAPAWTSASSLPGVRFHTSVGWPAASSCRTIGPPTVPVPMKPTAGAVSATIRLPAPPRTIRCQAPAM